MLGKRTVSDKKPFKNKAKENEIKDSIFSEQVMEYSQKQILDLDNNFSFHNFIQGAKEAFKLIVEAFNLTVSVSKSLRLKISFNKSFSFNILSLFSMLLEPLLRVYAKTCLDLFSKAESLLFA